MPLPLIPIIGAVVATGTALKVGVTINNERRVTCPICKRKVKSKYIYMCECKTKCKTKGCHNCVTKVTTNGLISKRIHEIDKDFIYKDILRDEVLRVYNKREYCDGYYCNRHLDSLKEKIEKIDDIIKKYLRNFEKIRVYKTIYNTHVKELILKKVTNKEIYGQVIIESVIGEIEEKEFDFIDETFNEEDVVRGRFERTYKYKHDTDVSNLVKAKLFASYYGYDFIYDYEWEYDGYEEEEWEIVRYEGDEPIQEKKSKYVSTKSEMTFLMGKRLNSNGDNREAVIN